MNFELGTNPKINGFRPKNVRFCRFPQFRGRQDVRGTWRTYFLKSLFRNMFIL